MALNMHKKLFRKSYVDVFFITKMKVVKVRVFISGMLLASALVAGSAHADLVEYDWQNEGDGLVSYDTETGAVWLDLTVTQNMSINQMKDALVNDSTFSGWRLPTVAEMNTGRKVQIKKYLINFIHRASIVLFYY